MKVCDFMAVFTIGTINSNCRVEISVSPLFEMMACLRNCYFNGGHADKCEDGLKVFYEKNTAALNKFYGSFEYGAQLAECILGMKEKHTFSNLLKFLKSLEKEEFIYYLLGRYIEVIEIKDILENSHSPREEIRKRIEKYNGIINEEQLEFIENYNATYNELIKLWTNFYQVYFKHKELDLEKKWDSSNKSLDYDLFSNGFDKVVAKLLTGYEIPEQFPGKETKLIHFYPSLFVSPKFIVIWGLGELNIVYDASIYLNDEINNVASLVDNKQIEKAEPLESLSEIGKSLSELGRIKILSLISNNPEIKSQEIAKDLNISTATVSRHLSLLKKNKLILERKENGFNIYSINQIEFENYFNNLKKHLFN